MAEKVLIVGGGFAGFGIARILRKKLRYFEVSLVDPLPYMTYQPFLPEVAAGSIEPRNAVVGHRRHLAGVRIISGSVTSVDHTKRVALVTPRCGEPWEEAYDQIVITAGAVSRTFPIPGVSDCAVGLKSIEEAVFVRDTLLSNYEHAAVLPPGPLRSKLLTLTVIGGGFAGIEAIAELRSLATAKVKGSTNIDLSETRFYLVEAANRIMPEVSLKSSKWVIDNLTRRGVDIRLETQLKSCVDGKIELSDGHSYESGLILWTAGVMANPEVAKGSSMPLDNRGRITVLPTLQICDGDKLIPHAWAAGDIAAVPDMSGGGVQGFCVPNAQHAVRQAKCLAKNLCLMQSGRMPRNYLHVTKGSVAGLGVGVGVLQYGRIAVRGFFGWFVHRAYHSLAVSVVERRVRITLDWFSGFVFKRNTVGLRNLDSPRAGFQRWAAKGGKKPS
ncbi:NAD(P)/FAD-dependent oxidoreductase [Tropheryma whipplei]|uniref:NADH dehydrogenase n=1 Tax=Tropheryma whipplei (strain Twist) TaxID=203267 RepID=Q83FG0_TROWT|nr:FAD-dependent oxidoreductase [Tropheryma whipplei]AAO44877.1 NADH dehydrogenase [Tropheryma whipplei str. Twist]MCO8182734.1 FAD-dependent oxidoreductase [Tropheryma whipplei]MCO8190469.1 FAD-dependent oxidoreductase [Tropheryma whipplei]CAD67449.1 putative NADH dehydrogenase [Tropheryma whipplei TW08/27]